WGVYARRFNERGQAESNDFRVNTTVVGDQWYSTVAMQANGNFVITWTSFGEDGSLNGIYAQQFKREGNAVGGEVAVNTTLTGNQWYPSVATDGDGGFVVVWSGEGPGDVDGVFAQRYQIQGGGGIASEEDELNVIALNDQGIESDQAPATAAADASAAAAVLAADGAPQAIAPQDSTGQVNTPAVTVADGLAALASRMTGTVGATALVFAERMSPAEPVEPPADNTDPGETVARPPAPRPEPAPRA